jgi:hypothetical protein
MIPPFIKLVIIRIRDIRLLASFKYYFINISMQNAKNCSLNQIINLLSKNNSDFKYYRLSNKKKPALFSDPAFNRS